MSWYHVKLAENGTSWGVGLFKYRKDTQTTQRRAKTRKDGQRHVKTGKDTQRRAKTRKDGKNIYSWQRHAKTAKRLFKDDKDTQRRQKDF